MQKRIGIVGGGGFVGLNLAVAAARRGHEVTVIDVADRLGRLASSGVLESAECQFVHLADRRAVYSLDVDAVVHLAALPHVDYSTRYPEDVFVNNTQVTASVLGMLRRSGVPIVFASSVEVYGGNSGAQFHEDDRLVALSPYAASKIACESLLDSYRFCYGLVATTVRFTNLYGPWQAPDRIIPRVILQAMLGLRSEIVTGRVRDVLHVDDAVEAILTIVDNGHWGQTFNISTGVGLSLEHIADTIMDAAGTGSYVTAPGPPLDGRGESLVASPARLMAATGWRPAIPLPAGIAQTVSWYSAHRDWWRELEPLVQEGFDGKDFLVDHLRPVGLPS